MVDEIIFRTDNPRNRLILELMARGGMRIGEVLNLRADDLDDRKLFIDRPKSGRQSEVVLIPRKVAERLREYIRSNGISPAERIFPIGYTGARAIVKKSGQAVGINLCPHDLRSHAATYASRAGAPLEIVSKVILVMPIWPPHNGIWARSAILKLCKGLKTSTVKINPEAGLTVCPNDSSFELVFLSNLIPDYSHPIAVVLACFILHTRKGPFQDL
ncbi:site-specific integrase [Desulfonatronospira sp.]|uniref:tyrosine-type recombinase/integrase n=1 Tax=Desulfonatronospira sp. TaxID=1962951 RepID=UPI0025C4B6D0|nr:site-specific integrase [Desulfonatronospira sp.]